MEPAQIALDRPAPAKLSLPLAGPTDHPVIAMPFHVEIDGRQFKGRGISLDRAEVGGLIDPHTAGTKRIAWVVFRFHGFTVGLSIEVRFQDLEVARGTATLSFLNPLGDHLPQLRHLINAYIAGDLVTLGNTVTVTPPTKPKANPARRRDGWLRRLAGTGLLLALTLALLWLVTSTVLQRVTTQKLSTPVTASFDGRILAATATGQVDFLNPDAEPGEIAFAIRSNSGPTLSVAMPCMCRVDVLGVAAGSTVFAGDPILRVSAPEAGLVLTGSVVPDELLPLALARVIEVKFVDGRSATARLVPGGIGSAAPGEPVPIRLIPTAPLPGDMLNLLAEVTLKQPLPTLIQPLAAFADQFFQQAKADAP